VIGIAWRNYQILAVQNPQKRDALLATMVDFIKTSRMRFLKEKSLGCSFSMEAYLEDIKPADSIGALIKYADQVQTEKDLEWFCGKFAELGYKPPLEHFKPILDEELKGQWLPVLREAKLKMEEIRTESEFLSFLGLKWSDKEKWKRGQAKVSGAV
jgi:hypothetical protein